MTELERIKNEFSDYSDIIEIVGLEKICERFYAIKDIYDKFVEEAGFNKGGQDIILNDRILIHAILDYFTDITRLKNFHDISLINQDKIIAHEISWLLRRKVIQVLKDQDETLVYINEKFLLVILVNHLLSGETEQINNSKKIRSFCDILLYHLKYRNCDAKVLEMLISAFKAGNSISKIKYI